MNEEKEIEKLNQGRLLREAGQVLLPLLSRMKEGVLGRITAAHRMNTPGALPAYAAELAVLTELEAKIKMNEKETEIREAKLYGSADTRTE